MNLIVCLLLIARPSPMHTTVSTSSLVAFTIETPAGFDIVCYSRGCISGLGRFNLLGDPALDIGDRVRYPGHCDLVVYPADLEVGDYPRETAGGYEEEIAVTVRNNGGAGSGAFVLRLTMSQGQNVDVVDLRSAGLDPGGSERYVIEWSEEWYTPPGVLSVEAVADPSEACDDSWRGNNAASVRVRLADIYPFDDGWPVEPAGVVSAPAALVDLDDDGDLEIVTVSGALLEARDPDGALLWRNREVPVTGSPMVADLDEDDFVEILASSGSSVAVFDGEGHVLCIQELGGQGPFAVAEMDDADGLELTTAEGSTLYLYSWDDDEFVEIDSEEYTLAHEPIAQSLSCADLNEDGYCETVYYCSYPGASGFPPSPSFYSLLVRDWADASNLSERTVSSDGPGPVVPCAGVLGGDAAIGFPLGTYSCGSSDPAQLIDPLGSSSPTACDQGDTDASCVKWGVFADWDSLTPGPDAFIIPAENQCLAWDDGGNALDGWSLDFLIDPYSIAGVTPPALADLNEDEYPDIILSLHDSGGGVVESLDSQADEPDGLGFPYALPGGVIVTSGFTVADIDGDEAPEIVFGTSDGLLHCWQVGECSEGYAPWVQDRHDSGRSGVLP